MAKQVLNNGETHGSIRGKTNENFTELYNFKESHKAENAAQDKLGHVKLPENWKTATLLNGWVGALDAAYGTAAYFIDAFGIVYLRGLITSGTITIGTVILQLDIGYRPPKDMILVCSTPSTYATIMVKTNGDVICDNVPNNSWLTLSGISFPTL